MTKRRFTKQKTTTRVQFLLKVPKPGVRGTFAITRRTISPGKRVTNETLALESLATINASYRSKHQSFETCLIQAKDVVAQLYEDYRSTLPIIPRNNENKQFLKRYWAEEYADRDLVSHEAAKNRLQRAIEALGHVPLFSASREEMQREIDQKFSGNKQRAVVATLNQLLRYIKREVKLRRQRADVLEVRYLSDKDFERIIPMIEDREVRLLHIVAFATGARMGEAFAMTPSDISNNSVYIATQIDRSRKRRETKNRVKRRCPILRQWMTEVVEWASLPLEQKLRIRNKTITRLTKSLCAKAFPDQPNKHCRFHDLRHSYAIYLISKGINLTLVSKALGDSIVVAEKFYSGFVLTPESLELINSVLDNDKKKSPSSPN